MDQELEIQETKQQEQTPQDNQQRLVEVPIAQQNQQQQQKEQQQQQQQQQQKGIINPFRRAILDNRELVNQILELGFCDLNKICKILMKCKGDKEGVLQKALKKMQKQEKKIEKKQEKFDKKSGKKDKKGNVIQELAQNYGQQFLVLAQKGYTMPKIVLKALQDCNGDVEQAEQQLKQKQQERSEKIGRRFWQKEYKEQIKLLISEDQYCYPRLIMVALNKNKGDLEKSKQFIQEYVEKFREKRVKEGHGHGHRHGHKHGCRGRSKGRRDHKSRSNSSSSSSSSSDSDSDSCDRKKRGGKKHHHHHHHHHHHKRGHHGGKHRRSSISIEKEEEKNDQFAELENFLKDLKLEAWDESITDLYVDANNLFFVNSQIRKKVLEKKGAQAEKVINELIKKFCEGKNNLKSIIVIYDNTSRVYEENGGKFKVLSAAPGFKTSDDYLVDMSGKLSENQLQNSLFTTSDRGLQLRLIQQGVMRFMKSGRFFGVIEDSMGTQNFDQFIQNSLDQQNL